jgi:nucleoid-associated protein YgaU
MGNMGGIERLMVFGILLIIITILGIAFFSASSIEDPFLEENDDNASVDSYYRNDVAAAGEPFSTNSPASPDGNLSGSVGQGAPSLKANTTLESSEDQDLAEESESTFPGESETAVESTTESLPVAEESAPVEPAYPRSYVIQKGDSFAKISRKIFGDEKWTARIVKANPGIDPLNLQVGSEIELPDISTDSTGTVRTGGNLIKMRTDVNTYTVKENDTLFKIAEKTYGNKRAWKKIYEANRDILLDPDSLIPGMELRLP